jgi:hypothetical protein
LVAAVAAFGLAIPASPSTASPYHETIITVAGPRIDWISGGYARFFHQGNAAISARWLGPELVMEVEGGNLSDYMRFSFRVPDGEQLRPGTYDHGISIIAAPSSGSSGRGCNSHGRFTIKEISLSPYGRVDRAWIVFEHRCDTSRPMLGEIRYRMPADGGDLLVGPRNVVWPETQVNGLNPAAPVRVVNTSESPVSVADVVLAGSEDIAIRRDECSGRSLVSNESCSVWLRFTPTTAGTHVATLDVVETSGASHRTDFRGIAVGTAEPRPPDGQPGAALGGGSTLFAYESDRGDFIGQGQDASYDSADGTFRAWGTSHYVHARIDLHNGQVWFAEFEPPEGDILVPGFSYAGATRVGTFYGDEAGLDVSGAGRGCNTLFGSFAVHALRVNDFGDLVEFHATFEQHCEEQTPAMHGTFRWQHPGPIPELPPYTPPPPDPVPQTFARRVTLSVRDQRASGAVQMETTVKDCRVGVPVRVQRRVDGVYRTFAVVVTNHLSRYTTPVGRRHGVYRAVTPPRELITGDTCGRAVSATWRY